MCFAERQRNANHSFGERRRERGRGDERKGELASLRQRQLRRENVRGLSLSLSSFTCINSTDKCLGIPEARFATIKNRALQRAKWKRGGAGGSGPLRIAAQMTARNRRSVDTRSR